MKELRGISSVTKHMKEFALKVSDYLMPKIAYVGEDSALAGELQMSLSWMSRLDDLEDNDSEIYILNSLPDNFLEVEKVISSSAVFILVVRTKHALPKRVVERLKKRIAVTLINPDINTIILAVKATLTLKEASYDLGQAKRIFSVEPDYRSSLSDCFKNLINGSLESSGYKFVISSGSSDELQNVKDTLISPMPRQIRPIELNHYTELKKKWVSHKYYTLTCTTKELHELEELLKTDHAIIRNKKLVVFHIGDATPEVPEVPLSVIRLDSLDARPSDKLLHQLMDKMFLSHEAFGNGALENTQNDSATGFILDEDIIEVMNLYKRMSLESIVLGVENAVLMELKNKAGSVKATLSAAGMAERTYFNKTSKHKDSKSVLSITSKK